MFKLLRYWHKYNLQKLQSNDWDDSPSFVWFMLILIPMLIYLICLMTKCMIIDWLKKKKEFWNEYKKIN